MSAARLASPPSPAERVAELDWEKAARDLGEYGAAVLPALLSPDECQAVATLYPDDSRFRSRIVMARHGFGKGEYKYFAYPLPDPISELRPALYGRLAPIANGWSERLGVETLFDIRHGFANEMRLA